MLGVDCMINSAGLFGDTASRLMSAPIQVGVHYEDVSNEAESHFPCGDACTGRSAARPGSAEQCGSELRPPT